MKTDKPNLLKSAASIVFGALCGGFVGVVLGVALAMGIGIWSQLSSPDDPSAGAVAIIVIATAPLGGLIGLVGGGLLMGVWPRVFMWTVFPLAVMFGITLATYSTLNSMDRPRHFVVTVGGTAGAEYIGEIAVDGKREQRKGVLPLVIKADALRLELAFALLHPQGGDEISVDVTSDGVSTGGGFDSPVGVRMEFESVGYSESFGGTSSNQGIMSQEDADRLIQGQQNP